MFQYKALECEKDSLLSLKKDRLKGQNEIIRGITSMAIKLGEELHEIHERNEILDNDELKKLKHLNEELMNRYEDRLSRSSQMQTDLCRWYEQMRVEPTDDLVLYAVNINLGGEDHIFDETFMDEMEEAHRRARSEHAKWVEQARFDYSEAMAKLSDLWEQCHVPVSERTFAPEFRSAIHSTVDVEKVKNEAERLGRLFSERSCIYEKLSKWRKLWEEKIEYERNVNDKSMYKNRGGSLQTVLKRQKYISNHLPQLLDELESEAMIYNEKHPENPILIDGLSPDEHVRLVMQDYAFQKEMEKYEKISSRNSATPRKLGSRSITSATPSPMSRTTLMKAQSHSHISYPTCRKTTSPKVQSDIHLAGCTIGTLKRRLSPIQGRPTKLRNIME
ncbi:hypothetical protein AB6A40_002398 [Gnathostoma spinigerum]|uniref:Protein regulator of cytokinesis 1 n=1 Tax=Gnathostoma spinigerum TaxID=75299 RepID=A0ABD6E6G9_9BILA